MRVHAALWPLLRGKVRVMDIAVDETHVSYRDTVSGMTLRARVDALTAGTVLLDPALHSVRLTRARVDGGEVAVFMGDGPSDSAPPTDTISFDWKIDVERFDLRDFGFALDMSADTVALVATPFDYRHVRAAEAGLSLRGFGFHAGKIATRFEDLHFVERSGLRVKDGSGDFAMGNDGLSLGGFTLETAGSHLKGSATAGSGITDANPATPVSVQLSATVAGSELALFAPVPAPLEQILNEKTVTLDGVVSGTLDDLKLERLSVALPHEIKIEGYGALRGVTIPERFSGSVTMDAELTEPGIARSFIADTALRRRIAIPREMRLHATADFSLESYYVKELTLRVDTGRLDAKGRYSLPANTYAADIRITDFPLGKFLPRDSLGTATITLQAKGRGYDPLTMKAEATLDIDRFDYKDIDLGLVTAGLKADGGRVTGEMKSRSGLLTTDITFDALLARDTLAFERLFSPVTSHAPISYTLAAQVDSTVVRLADTLRLTEPVTIRASASSAGTTASLRSGDLAIDISSPLPPDSLIRNAARTGSEIERQLIARHFSADSLESAFPRMILTARAGTGNFLHEFASTRGFDYKSFSADVSTTAGNPFHIDATAVGINSGGLELDTVSLHALRNGNMLDYEMRLANRPTTVTDLGLIRVSGSAGGRTLTAGVLQQNSDGTVGFDFGVRASLRDSTIRAEMASDPILGYERWKVGADSSDKSANGSAGWIEYGMDGALRADLLLTSEGQGGGERRELKPSELLLLGSAWGIQSAGVAMAPARRIAITSASLPGIPEGALRLTIHGLDLERMFDLLPTAPPMGGIIMSDIIVGFHRDGTEGNIIAAKGTLGAKDFTYDKHRLADIDTDIDFISDGAGQMLLDAGVRLDGHNVLTAKGAYAAESIDFDVDVPAAPLSLVHGLLPPETAVLTGSLDGRIRIAGNTSRPAITGEVGFTDAKIDVAMTGTALGISPERIAIADNRITFNNFGLISPDDRRLTVNGSVNIADFSAPRVDLAIRARDFRFVNSTHIGGSQIYGTAALDAGITARGTLDAMTVRGNVDLSEDTDIVYIMRDGGQKVRDEKQHIVQFVTFAADSLATDGAALSAVPVRRVGMDMLLDVNIGEGLTATLSLDEVNENRVELIGGGDLAFSMNRQGDTRLAGRYTLSGGTLYYKPPVIPQKIFFVSDGSYVEWTGAPASPEMHVVATQTMDVRLDSDDGSSRDVTFDISVAIAGSLAGIDMMFDLAAPSDIAIQDQLLAMSPEAKMQQALTLLIYNQYTGPGVSSRGMAFDARSQLNDFVSKEINQWARNNLRGVDFSMGINTSDDGMGDSRTDYSYSVSKTLFSDRVKISIGGKVSDEATSSEGFADNLLEDVTLEYRLTRRDNMFLKLYRYNTRESILEGEVTETGGGFVIRKKMSRLRDIFRRTRPRTVGRGMRTDSLILNNAGRAPGRTENGNR